MSVEPPPAEGSRGQRATGERSVGHDKGAAEVERLPRARRREGAEGECDDHGKNYLSYMVYSSHYIYDQHLHLSTLSQTYLKMFSLRSKYLPQNSGKQRKSVDD